MNWTSRRGLLWIAAGLAAVAIGLAAGPLPWRLARGLPAPPAAAPPSGGGAPPVALDPAIALSPFGRAAAPEAPEPESQETALSLVLLGVVIATEPKASTAILDGGTGPSRVYTVGSEVAPGATLAAVFVDHVELSVDGRVETLSFPTSTGGGVGAAPLAQADGASQGERPPAPETEAGSGVAEIVAQYQGEMHDNPEAVLDDLGLVATENGYEVQPEGSEALLPAGFQPGDVITKVNGQQVGNIARDVPFFNNVVASGHARIDLLRNGQRIVLSFPLK